jgi:hypothetical protein
VELESRAAKIKLPFGAEGEITSFGSIYSSGLGSFFIYHRLEEVL